MTNFHYKQLVSGRIEFKLVNSFRLNSQNDQLNLLVRFD